MNSIVPLRFGAVIKYSGADAQNTADKLCASYQGVCEADDDDAYFHTVAMEDSLDVYAVVGKHDTQVTLALENMVNMAEWEFEKSAARTKLHNFLKRQAGEFVLDA